MCVCVYAKHFLLLVYTTFVNKNKTKKPNRFKTHLRLVIVILESAVYPLWRLLETPFTGEPSRSVWGLFNPASLSKLFYWPLPAQFTVPRLTGVFFGTGMFSGAGVFFETSFAVKPSGQILWPQPHWLHPHPMPAPPVPSRGPSVPISGLCALRLGVKHRALVTRAWWGRGRQW